MTTDLTPSPRPDIETARLDLAAMSTEDLREELAASLRMTAESLLRVALVVRTLEERGEDLSDLRIGILPYLRQIAYGQVLPEVVVRFGRSPSLVRRIGALPIPDQRRLAAGDAVELIVVGREGERDHLRVDPLHMSQDQVVLAFGPGRIRPLEEQAAMLHGRKPERPPSTGAGKIKVDHKTGRLKVGRTALDVADVLNAVAELRIGREEAEGPEGDATKPVVVYLTEDQHRALKVLAAQKDNTMSGLILRAMHAAGLI